jgi:hypothetical protein
VAPRRPPSQPHHGRLESPAGKAAERRRARAVARAPSPSRGAATTNDSAPTATVANLDLLLISDYDSLGDRYRTGAYAAWRLHASHLLREAGHETDRADGLAHVALAPLAADLMRHRLRDDGAARPLLRAELDDLATVLCETANVAARRRR